MRKWLPALLHPVANLRLGEVSVPIFGHLVEVCFHVLENKEQLIILADNLLQLHDVGVAELLQGLFGQQQVRA